MTLNAMNINLLTVEPHPPVSPFPWQGKGEFWLERGLRPLSKISSRLLFQRAIGIKGVELTITVNETRKNPSHLERKR